MAQRRHHQSKRSKPRVASGSAGARAPAPALERKPPVRYAKPFVLLEDAEKSTFIYSNAQWVRYHKSIAECRVDCQVKELAQKIKGMTRYEVCTPMDPLS